MSLYYEVHVTLEPVFGDKLEQLKKICLSEGFRVADLLMQKRREDSPNRSKYDTFCTGRYTELDVAKDATYKVLQKLKEAEFVVWRYKIEETILDSNLDDKWYPLEKLGVSV